MDRMDLWRVQLPADLGLGVHRVDVMACHRHPRKRNQTLLVEVRDERPPALFRRDPWQSE